MGCGQVRHRTPTAFIESGPRWRIGGRQLAAARGAALSRAIRASLAVVINDRFQLQVAIERCRLRSGPSGRGRGWLWHRDAGQRYRFAV